MKLVVKVVLGVAVLGSIASGVVVNQFRSKGAEDAQFDYSVNCTLYTTGALSQRDFFNNQGNTPFQFENPVFRLGYNLGYTGYIEENINTLKTPFEIATFCAKQQ